MTIKFLKEWKQPVFTKEDREKIQTHLDGGSFIRRTKVAPNKNAVLITDCDRDLLGPAPGEYEVYLPPVLAVFYLDTPAKAVKFAAALRKLRRPVRLLKQDLDQDWSERVKARDDDTCALCGVKGAKEKPTTFNDAGKPIYHRDSLTAHHWLKTKSHSGMARWARPCGVTVHFAEHIHTLHENPCWVDLVPIYNHVLHMESTGAIEATAKLSKVVATEARVRKAWFEMKTRENENA